jgi:RNA polymerase sigma-70 factor (ECF subfamily)
MALPLRATPDEPGAAGQAQGGRTAADFDDVYRTTYPRIFRTLASILGDAAAAEDCTQDAFVKALRAWPTWKRDAPVEAWLHRIAINTAISYRRAQAVRDLGRLVRLLGRPVEADPTDQALGGELLTELRRLPPRQAAAIVLRHLHGYTNREIAAALDVPESTVATRLMTARRTLRARLGPFLEERSDTSAPGRVPPSE